MMVYKKISKKAEAIRYEYFLTLVIKTNMIAHHFYFAILR